MKNKKNKILLIISGGIAAYKSLELIRLLDQEGIKVLPVMTESAKSFVTPLSVSVISGEKVASHLFDIDSEMDYSHIALSREVDLIVVAPATANILAKIANGLADDLASSILLATDKKVMVAPSMNVKMWEHFATQRNIRQLIENGIDLIGPEKGIMACGEYGDGRMSETKTIFEAIKRELDKNTKKPLLGRKILVTSGPTEESIDPVRYISNRSSGIQGRCIADSLVRLGAQVIFISGPVDISPPAGPKLIDVTSAVEMQDAVKSNGPYDVAICVAAVSDWRPKNVFNKKLKKDKSKDSLKLEFIKNPDILSDLGESDSRPKLIIGFSAETENVQKNAKQKLEEKKCDWILSNNVNPETKIMGGDETEITLITRAEIKSFPRMSKVDFADLLVERIVFEIT